jgi:hypothetical protein
MATTGKSFPRHAIQRTLVPGTAPCPKRNRANHHCLRVHAPAHDGMLVPGPGTGLVRRADIATGGITTAAMLRRPRGLLHPPYSTQGRCRRTQPVIWTISTVLFNMHRLSTISPLIPIIPGILGTALMVSVQRTIPPPHLQGRRTRSILTTRHCLSTRARVTEEKTTRNIATLPHPGSCMICIAAPLARNVTLHRCLLGPDPNAVRILYIQWLQTGIVPPGIALRGIAPTHVLTRAAAARLLRRAAAYRRRRRAAARRHTRAPGKGQCAAPQSPTVRSKCLGALRIKC